MTEKIMIDGIVVSECEYLMNKDIDTHSVNLNANLCNMDAERIRYCKKGNCLYKQLKRKEQECEKLQKENDILKQYKGSKQASYETMQKEWNKTIWENRSLTQQLALKNKQLEVAKETLESFITDCDPNTINYRLIEISNNAQQALQQIKELEPKDV